MIIYLVTLAVSLTSNLETVGFIPNFPVKAKLLALMAFYKRMMISIIVLIY